LSHKNKIKEIVDDPRTKSRKGFSNIKDKSGFIKNMLRGKAVMLTAVLVGSMALSTGFFIRKQIPFFTGYRTPYSLEMMFLDHGSKEKAAKILGEIDKRNSKDVKIFFTESAQLSKDEYRDIAISDNETLRAVHQSYVYLQTKGFPKEDIEKHCMDMLKQSRLGTIGDVNSRDFLLNLFLGLAERENIVLVPLESFSREDIAHGKKYMEAYRNFALEWNRVVGYSNLDELANLEIQMNQKMIEEIGFRNIEVAENIKNRFEFALEISPELKASHLNGEQIYGIGFMGIGHEPLQYLFNNKNSIDFKFYVVTDPDKIKELVIASMTELRPLTKKEAYLFAIGEKFDNVIMGLRKDRPGLGERFANRAISLSLQELEDINNEASNVKGLDERSIFMFNRILGVNLLTLVNGELKYLF
jgi:hypothetical protein